MPFSSKEQQIKYDKKYYQKHKELIALKNKIYYKENAEEIKFNNREYKQKNKIKIQNDMSMYGKKYRLLNKNNLIIKRKKHNDELWMKVLDFYTDGKMACVCCGERIIDFLTIDHIHNNGKKHRKELGASGMMFYSWLIKNNFPNGFQVLCFNCNCGRSKRRDKICPHKTRFIHPGGLPIETVKGNVDSITKEPLILRVDGRKFVVGL